MFWFYLLLLWQLLFYYFWGFCPLVVYGILYFSSICLLTAFALRGVRGQEPDKQHLTLTFTPKDNVK